ncbi:MAG: response regulator [Bacteroidota bacterium]|nr:response regulator [Bacteroidota bacterium]
MKKILLIEDNNHIRENTAEIMELANYRVFTAENGKAGVEIALRENPDLIICDIMMPVLDGYGVLHMLHKNPLTRNTPFIFLTAKTDRTDFRKGMDLGADDYITKPFSDTELLNAVESRLAKREFLREDGEARQHNENRQQRSTADLLDELKSGRNTNRYRKKQVIFLEGNRPQCLYYVVKGRIKTFKTNEQGKELVVDLFNEGDFLGYIPLLENTAYKESAEAIEESELAVIPKEDFEELVENSPEISRQFIQLLARNITEKENQLLGLAYNSLRKKVANALMAIYRKYNGTGNKSFSIDISRENLASIAGTATESLIRTLSDFKSEKLIDIRDGGITVLNETKLEKMIN